MPGDIVVIMMYAKTTPIICTTKLLSTLSVYNVNHNLYTSNEPDAGSIINPEHPKYKAKPFLRREVTHLAKWLLKRQAEKYAFFDNLYIVRGLSEALATHQS